MKTVGVVIADEYEYLPFLRVAAPYGVQQSMRRGCESAVLTVGENRIIAVKCGIGKVAAATAAAFLIADDGAEQIMNIGLSGAVAGFAEGELILGTEFTECDFDLTAIGRAPGENPSKPWRHQADATLLAKARRVLAVRTGAFGCGDLFLADPVRKQFFSDTFHIHAFDMETGAIASVCEAAGVPFLSLRQLSDSADDCSAQAYTAANALQPETLSVALLRLLETAD